jgi:hypothetical protein
MNKSENKNLKQFDKKWLVNIELSNPKLASNMRKYIREGNWDKMEACLRNALLWGCSGEKTNNESYIIKYENLNKLTENINLQSIDNETRAKSIKLSAADMWDKENSVLDRRPLSTGKSLIDNFNKPYIQSSGLLSPGRIRILAISDSYGEGAGLYDIRETWPKELEKQLNSIEDKFEVITLAASGANYMDFHRYITSTEVKELNPDIIILSLVSNDIYFYSPTFEKDFDSLYSKAGLNSNILNYVKCINGGFGFGKQIKMIPLLKKVKEIFLYRYCDSYNFTPMLLTNNEKGYRWVNLDEIYKTYKKMNELSPSPLYIFNMFDPLLYDLQQTESEKKDELMITLAKAKSTLLIDRETSNKKMNLYSKTLTPQKCNSMSDLTKCYNANPYDYHSNLLFTRALISNNIENIFNYLNNIQPRANPNQSPITNHSKLILETLPYQIRYKNTDNLYEVISYDGASELGIKFPNDIKFYQTLCAFENRNHIRVNLNENIINGKTVEIKLLFNEKQLLIKNTGYNKEGTRLSTDYVNLEKDTSFTFVGGADKNSIVIALDREGCYDEIWGLGLTKISIKIID